jgi:hypothetical protein
LSARALGAGGAFVILALAAPLAAQVAPHGRWSTIRTAHFHVHFPEGLEEPARRAAAYAERAYSRLTGELVPPRGPIDMVVADNVDLANGFATPFPSNRITIYTYAPLASPSLRFYEDWLELVVTHELTHIFHGDRVRGWWRGAQYVLGRAPFLFPTGYAPSWISEGLATYYESKLTGAGRVYGSYHRMLVRAAALSADFPDIGDWSRVTTRYPTGDIAYGFGSLLLAYIVETRGEGALRDFVERAARAPLPFTLGSVARASFGTSFERAWEAWRDSVRRDAPPPNAPLAGWRDLTHAGRLAAYPRWVDSNTIVYAASTGRETTGAYRVTLTGGEQRIARRNDTDVNAPAPDGRLLFAQLELSDPYHVRSDLYVGTGTSERRLTHNARLTHPDVREDGTIVAVRAVAATNQLVILDSHGALRAPLTRAAPDTQWAEPRWSPDGSRLAVTRWVRGGHADVVVLDTLGALVRQLTADRAFDSSPSWTPDGRYVVFASDRTGIPELYVVAVDVPDAEAHRLSHTATGLYYPAVSPDGRHLAAARYAPDGWHIGVAPFDSGAVSVASASRAGPASTNSAPPDAPRAGGPVRSFSPWRSLVPRYWLPMVGERADGGISIGALTSATDVIGRHAYTAELLIDPANGEHEGDVFYRYAGFGQPVIDLYAEQGWARRAIFDEAERVGTLSERSRTVGLSATVSRPRVRTTAWVSAGGELEMLSYSTAPGDLLPRLDPFFSSSPHLRTLLLAAGWSNTRRPALAISPEDGVSISVNGRLRWLSDETGVDQRSVIAAAAAYKSIDLPGFAHHVLAARAAWGASGGDSPRSFSVGGTSGAPLPVLPGLTFGQRRTFGVRGFPPGSRAGSHAIAGTLEYRVPLAHPSEGEDLWPVFLDRVSAALFADAGTAWTGGVGDPAGGAWLVSLGAELNLDAAVPYDVPYRLRLGVAIPVSRADVPQASSITAYVRLGPSF